MKTKNNFQFSINCGIPGKIYLGYETVRNYRKNLHIKLGAHNIIELTRIALDRKLM
jgi:DNA-binding NarL/FixJ family response regulator